MTKINLLMSRSLSFIPTHHWTFRDLEGLSLTDCTVTQTKFVKLIETDETDKRTNTQILISYGFICLKLLNL